jgi:prefoldin alpha subunit
MHSISASDRPFCSGQVLQLPLTQSLYTTGTIADTETFLIDIGTGYFVEMSAADGQAYCKRKMAQLTESLHNLNGLITEKRTHLQTVSRILAAKLDAQAQA